MFEFEELPKKKLQSCLLHAAILWSFRCSLLRALGELCKVFSKTEYFLFPVLCLSTAHYL